MADLKLFSLQGSSVHEKMPTPFKYEREIQKLCEQNMETFFGIRFVASEYSTGNKHKGRIDSLGLDENDCPVIIEYKLDSKENVINQGLFYLDWLMDHQANFELLCMEKFHKRIEIDWSNPRLLCIARDFTRYDDYAIGQINRNIELIRYRVFDNEHLLFELAGTSQKQESNSTSAGTAYRTMSDAVRSSPGELMEMVEELEDYIMALGDDVQKKELKTYYAYARIKNFTCLELRSKKQEMILYLKLKYSELENPTPNMRDVTHTGHAGTGDTEIVIASRQQLEQAKPFIEMSYNRS